MLDKRKKERERGHNAITFRGSESVYTHTMTGTTHGKRSSITCLRITYAETILLVVVGRDPIYSVRS